MTDQAPLRTCVTCWAQVRADVMHLHEDWHSTIARVAIETTRRVERLEGERP